MMGTEPGSGDEAFETVYKMLDANTQNPDAGLKRLFDRLPSVTPTSVIALLSDIIAIPKPAPTGLQGGLRNMLPPPESSSGASASPPARPSYKTLHKALAYIAYLSLGPTTQQTPSAQAKDLEDWLAKMKVGAERLAVRTRETGSLVLSPGLTAEYFTPGSELGMERGMMGRERWLGGLEEELEGEGGEWLGADGVEPRRLWIGAGSGVGAERGSETELEEVDVGGREKEGEMRWDSSPEVDRRGGMVVGGRIGVELFSEGEIGGVGGKVGGWIGEEVVGMDAASQTGRGKVVEDWSGSLGDVSTGSGGLEWPEIGDGIGLGVERAVDAYLKSREVSLSPGGFGRLRKVDWGGEAERKAEEVVVKARREAAREREKVLLEVLNVVRECQQGWIEVKSLVWLGKIGILVAVAVLAVCLAMIWGCGKQFAPVQF